MYLYESEPLRKPSFSQQTNWRKAEAMNLGMGHEATNEMKKSRSNESGNGPGTLERMESTSSGGARTPGAAAREHRTVGSRRRGGRWRGASGGVAEEKRRAGEAAAAEADIFIVCSSALRVVIAGPRPSPISTSLFFFNHKKTTRFPGRGISCLLSDTSAHWIAL
jgi:hypothetical protein